MSEVNAALLEIRKKNLTQVEPVTVPVEEKSNSVTTTEIPDKPAAEAELKEQPKPEPTKATIEEKVVEVDKGWDDTETEITTTKTSKVEYDFSDLSSALELGEVKNREEFIAKISETKSKLKQLEDAPLSGIPEDFKEVIEIARKSGDWKTFLAEEQVDWAKVDPISLYEDEWRVTNQKNPAFFTDGKFNEALFEDSLAAIPDSQKYFDGVRIQQGYVQNQMRRKAELRARAEEKSSAAEKSLAQATRNLQEILPLENYGIKFDQKHSSEMYQGIVSSKLTKKHLGMTYEDLVRSGADMKAVTRSITLAEKGEKMLSYKANNSKNEAKKEILTSTQNVNLNPNGSFVNPDNPEKREVTPKEKLEKYVAAQKNRGI